MCGSLPTTTSDYALVPGMTLMSPSEDMSTFENN
jgi:hypothetical protein